MYFFQEKRRSRGLESGSDTEHERTRRPGVRIQDPEPAVRIQEQPAVLEEQREALVLFSNVEEQHERAPADGGDVREQVRVLVRVFSCAQVLIVLDFEIIHYDGE